MIENVLIDKPYLFLLQFHKGTAVSIRVRLKSGVGNSKLIQERGLPFFGGASEQTKTLIHTQALFYLAKAGVTKQTVFCILVSEGSSFSIGKWVYLQRYARLRERT